MTLEHTPFNEVVPIIESFFGARVSVQSVDSATQKILFVLYDAFAFRTDIDERGSFGVVRIVGKSPAYPDYFLGRNTSLRTGEEQIRGALEAIDEYCRLQLPEKYLEAFEAVVARSSTVAPYSSLMSDN